MKKAWLLILTMLLAAGLLITGCTNPTGPEEDLKEYTVILDQPTGGTISASPAKGTAGTTITLSNTPDSTHDFGYYTIDGVAINGNTFQLGAKNVSVSAVFNLKGATLFTVTLSQPPQGGTIDAAPKSAVTGTTVTLTNTPASGFELDYYTVDGVQISGNSFLLTANVTVSAMFKAEGTDISYTPFPEDEIVYANIYAGDEMQNAGVITKNEDGTYTAKVKVRNPGTSQSAIYFTGPFTFEDHYSLTLDLPADSSINPTRVYTFASSGSNENGADWSRAFDTGSITGSGEITASNGDVALPVSTAKYKTVGLYLYFAAGQEGQEYTFTIKELKAAKATVPPPSPVTSFVAYRNEPWTGPEFSLTAPLHGLNYSFDSGTVAAAAPQYLEIDLHFPKSAKGKYYQATLSRVGVYSGTTNIIDDAVMLNAFVWNTGDYSRQNDVITKNTDGTFTAGFKIIQETESDCIAKLMIPGTFTNSDRFTLRINLAPALLDELPQQPEPEPEPEPGEYTLNNSGQAIIPGLTGGVQFTAGDVWILEYAFTSDINTSVDIMLCDNASWAWLSGWSHSFEALTAGTEYKGIKVIPVTTTSSGTGDNANSLDLLTSEGATQGAKLTFTTLKLYKQPIPTSTSGYYSNYWTYQFDLPSWISEDQPPALGGVYPYAPGAFADTVADGKYTLLLKFPADQVGKKTVFYLSNFSVLSGSTDNITDAVMAAAYNFDHQVNGSSEAGIVEKVRDGVYKITATIGTNSDAGRVALIVANTGDTNFANVTEYKITLSFFLEPAPPID